ncbi:MAG: hypothetical protein Q4B19_00115 [Clostridia bacterium]|nr:hypothetical protein [Clostridia bacterium]
MIANDALNVNPLSAFLPVGYMICSASSALPVCITPTGWAIS